MPSEQRYCEKCNRAMSLTEFYQSNNREKYPEGFLNICKKCLTMHVDNWNPDSFLWILQEIDVPWIPDEWNKLMATYAKDNKKLTGTTILGRYLSKMKLKQHKDYRWKDTAFLQEMAQAKMEQAMRAQGYETEAIERAKLKQTFEMPDRPLEIPDLSAETSPSDPHAYNGEDYFAEQAGAVNDDLDLTDEDRTYLRLKWGKTYRPDEWVYLEQFYNEMMESYDIQSAGHIDTLKLLCKTSLKCNQLIDIGDVEGYQKMSKVYDSLMKSGKFTAAQNKAEQGEFVDSVGELIELCEKEGYIERFYVTQPNDKVDFTLQDMFRYTKTLVEGETNLSQMIEQAIKQNIKEDEDAAANTESEIVDEDDISIEDIEHELKDEDFSDFNDFMEDEEKADAELLQLLNEEGDQ